MTPVPLVAERELNRFPAVYVVDLGKSLMEPSMSRAPAEACLKINPAGLAADPAGCRLCARPVQAKPLKLEAQRLCHQRLTNRRTSHEL